MYKKLLVSAVVCVFLGLHGGLAEEKGLILEHLNWTQTGFGEAIYATVLESPDKFAFDTGTFLTFSVPPSPKAEALIFEFQAQAIFFWWIGREQAFQSNARLNLVSSCIPSGIVVYFETGMGSVKGITHTSTEQERTRRNARFILRRDSMLREYPDWWYVRHVDGSDVEPEEAQVILNGLINNGFNVEVSISGYAKGVSEFMFYAITVETTRLVKP